MPSPVWLNSSRSICDRHINRLSCQLPVFWDDTKKLCPLCAPNKRCCHQGPWKQLQSSHTTADYANQITTSPHPLIFRRSYGPVICQQGKILVIIIGWVCTWLLKLNNLIEKLLNSCILLYTIPVTSFPKLVSRAWPFQFLVQNWLFDSWKRVF